MIGNLFSCCMPHSRQNRQSKEEVSEKEIEKAVAKLEALQHQKIRKLTAKAEWDLLLPQQK